MLSGISEVEEDGKATIAHYLSVKHGSLEAMLGPRARTLPNAKSVATMGENLGEIARTAAAHLAIADQEKAATGRDPLSEQTRYNLAEMADELAIAAAEFKDASDVDRVWSQQDRGRKETIAQQLTIRRDVVDLLRARGRGDLRKQKAPPAPPVSGNGTGNPR